MGIKTLAILGRKGGVGKTMLGVNLAVAAQAAGHSTLLVDLDPQASAAKWGDQRSNGTPVVVATPASRLPEVLKKGEAAGATLAIIDTAPSMEVDLVDVARAAEMVLIPCKPANVDLKAIVSTINVVRMADVQARIVFNDVPARGNRGDQAREAVGVFDVPVVPFDIGHRVAFVDAFNGGQTVQEYEPRGKASGEIQELYTYISTEMGV